MIRLQKEKIFKFSLYLLSFSIFLIILIFVLIVGHNIFGTNRGLFFSAISIVTFFLILFSLFLPLKYFCYIYILLLPFFLRLNVTRFYIEMFDLKLHPIVLSQFFFISIGFIKIFIEGKFPKKYDINGFLISLSFLLLITGGIVSSLITKTAVGGDTTVSFLSFIFAFPIPFSFFFIYSNSINNLSELKTILVLFVFSIFLNSITGLLNIITRFNLVEIFVNRASFNFIGPNVYAATVLIFVPISFFLFNIEKKLKKFILFIIFLVINLSILMTISRGGLLSLFLIYILFFILIKDYRKNISILFNITLVVALFAFGLLFNVISRFFTIFTRTKVTEFSTLIRVNAWKLSISQIPHNLLGIGGNQFPHLWRNYGAFPDQLVLHSHNLILGLTIEYGILAILGFLLFNGLIILKLYQVSKKVSGDIKNLSLSFFISLISFFFMGSISEGPRAHLSNEGFLTNDPLVVYYILLGIIYSFLKILNYEEKNIDTGTA